MRVWGGRPLRVSMTRQTGVFGVMQAGRHANHRRMKIVTWNINGVRARIDNLLHWLQEANPDIVCLQEIKTLDEGFPASRSRRWATTSRRWDRRGSTASPSCRSCVSTR
jgi:endonuclease/exonuclease/phosphatase family metal-dependent hydrolase